MLRNDTPRAGHWLKIRPVNRHGSPALNARVTLTTGATRQLRELRSGSSYQSQNALEVHFGVGKATKIDTLKIAWPGGRESELREIDVDRTVTVREPG